MRVYDAIKKMITNDAESNNLPIPEAYEEIIEDPSAKKGAKPIINIIDPFTPEILKAPHTKLSPPPEGLIAHRYASIKK